MRRSTKKALMICGGITAATIVIVTVILVSLIFTVFKPKDPVLVPHPTKLQNVSFKIFPTLSMNASLSMTITIYNRNYGSFRFKDTNSSVNYRGNLITEIPIQGATVPARSSINITGSTNITAEKLVTSPFFIKDLTSGHLNLTSTSDMRGKVSVLKIFKFGASVFSSCDIIIFMKNYAVEGTCQSKLKL